MIDWLTKLFGAIKIYAITITAVVAAVFAGLFLWYKRKAEVDQALLDNEKMNEQLVKQDSQISENNKLLSSEEQKRKEIANEQTPSTNITDIVDRINRK